MLDDRITYALLASEERLREARIDAAARHAHARPRRSARILWLPIREPARSRR